MIRKIIKINEEKCIGCGACVTACHEGAIGMSEGKAKLMREDYCDGLGDCLPACPVGAIEFEEREAPAFNEASVISAKKNKSEPLPYGCPGKQFAEIKRENTPVVSGDLSCVSRLSQWPVQIRLIPANAPCFDGADLLIAADCTAYVYGRFHEDFIKNRITLIGCPKLDEADYTEKLTQIIGYNNIRSLTVVRMEVPCCGGIEQAAKLALQRVGKDIPWKVVIISTDGSIE